MHEDVAELGVRAIACHAVHVVEVLLGRVGAEVHVGELGLGQVDQRLDVLGTVVDEPCGAGGVGRVAAALLDGRSLEHDDARARVARGDGSGSGRIPGADNDDVGIQISFSHFDSFLVSSSRVTACTDQRMEQTPSPIGRGSG